MHYLTDPIKNTTKKAKSWIPGHRGTAPESSPLLDAGRRQPSPPATAASPSSSDLSFSQEYKPFESSRTALLLCLFHVIAYLGVSVAAFGFGFEKWGVINSIYFGVVTFTTIGYGDLAPSTDAGRLFMVFFALYGIGILGAFLSILGEAFIEAGHRAMAETEARAKKRVLAMFASSDDEDDYPQNKTLCRELCMTTVLELPIICLLLALTILLGLPSGRSIISSIYFAVVTATTIGFGDMHPTDTWMRAIYIFYLPFSVAVFGQILSKIAGVYMQMKAREADEKFLNRSLALRDLKAMDVDGDGKVGYGEFLSFIMVAMGKVEQDEVEEIHTLFKSLDVDGLAPCSLQTLFGGWELMKQLHRSNSDVTVDTHACFEE